MAEDLRRLRHEMECDSILLPRRGISTTHVNACIIGLLAIAATIVVVRTRSVSFPSRFAPHVASDDPLFTLL